VKIEKRFAEADVKIETRFVDVEVKLVTRFAQTDGRIERLRSDVTKWMFVYWSGTMLALAGFVFAVLRK
jgi:hypothetical protein